MPERIKEILQKILDWWNKFTTKQKTAIISIVSVVVFTLAIIIWVLSRPTYVQWQQCSTTKETSEIIKILDDNKILYRTSTDGLSIRVKTSQVGAANLALGASGYMPDQYTINDAISGGLSTTQADKQKQYVYYMEKKLASDISTIEQVKSALVTINIPDNTGTLISTDEESWAWIQLTLYDKLSPDQAATIARAVATALGNSSTANIVIVDNNANLLFSGEEDYSTAGVANNMLELRAQAETMVGADVKKVLVGTQQYDMVEVKCNLDINFAEYQETVHEYYANAGYVDGMKSHEEVYEDSNTTGAGGIPGTDSNNETTNMWLSGESTESSSSQRLTDYLPNEVISVKNLPPGIINLGNSSLSVAAITYRTIKYEDAKSQGLLDGITWEEYKAANSGSVKKEVDEDFYNLVATATGINVENITIVAYEMPQFIDKQSKPVNVTDILSIVLIILILGLLAFVIIRSMASRKEVEEEEELSVENLLQSTPEPDVEDIEIETKSETRKMIEKFVDDNPEAAANLLRNWLNEDWG